MFPNISRSFICSLFSSPSPLHITISLSFADRRTATRNFPGLHARVAETAVERNFRLRGKKPPCANIAIKLMPRKKPRLPVRLRPGFNPPSLSPRSSVHRFARSTGRLQDRRKIGRKRQIEREQVQSFRNGKMRSRHAAYRRSRHAEETGGRAGE